MVFAASDPPAHVDLEYVAYGTPALCREGTKGTRPDVEKSLKAAFLWDEVKDRLSFPP